MPGIVVGIDGSDHSQRALHWALREAAVRHAPLTVLTVHEVMLSAWNNPVTYPADADLLEQTRKAAQETTDRALAEMGDARPASVTVEAVSGVAAHELLRAGEDADLIVVGSRGGGGFTRMLLGSVSSKVTQHARVPVVVVPAEDGG